MMGQAMMPMNFMGAFVIFLCVALAALFVLWLVLPFSVFGVKDLLRELIAEQKKTNELLKAVIEDSEKEQGRGDYGDFPPPGDMGRRGTRRDSD
ncbi:MAG TPA: hypothetical protein ENJ37_09310 [Deltaproteobacteria bacterium]|nr:hypothetical protein [Deltaproteobacteria bacterium]